MKINQRKSVLKGVQEFVAIFHRNIWILHVLFVGYFGISLNAISNKKYELDLMKFEIRNFKNISLDGLKTIFEESEYAIEKIAEQDVFYCKRNGKSRKEDFQALRSNFDYFQSDEFISDEIWEGKIEDVQNQFLHRFYFTMEDSKSLNWGIQYPSIRHFVAKLAAWQSLHEVYDHVIPYSCNLGGCNYFDPIVQKVGNTHLLYPVSYSKSGKQYPSYSVNGVPLEGSTFTFHPIKKGIHTLEIEYTYWMWIETKRLKFTKEILVI